MTDSRGTSTGNDNSGSGGIVSEEVKQQAQQTAQQAQQAVQQATQQATQGAKSMLDNEKDTGAQMLSQTADALRKAGKDLQQNKAGMAANVVDGAAGALDGFSSYLQDHSVTDLIDEVETYARQNTPIFLGGAVVLGIAIARFLKSSPPSQQGQGQSGRYSQGYPPYSRYQGGRRNYQGGQYNYGNVPYGREDVGGTPYVVRDYSPGLTGQGTEAPYDNASYSEPSPAMPPTP